MLLKISNIFIVTLFSYLLFASAGAGEIQESQMSDQQLLEELEEKMAAISTVSAEFRQEKELPVLEKKMIIQGRMALEIPDNIAWHVDEPVRYRMSVRDSQLKQWDEDTDQVQTLNLERNPVYGAMFQQLTGWFSGRYETLLEYYELTVKSTHPPVLVFRPRPETMFDDILISVTLVFGEDVHYIEKIIMQEVNESVSTIYFHDAQFDIDIDEQVWKVRPPE